MGGRIISAYCLETRRKFSERDENAVKKIRPISDLRNYTAVLNDVTEGSPVFLSGNDRCKYVIVDMRDYDRAQATIRLLNELEKGRRSGEENGWLTPEEVREHLGITEE